MTDPTPKFDPIPRLQQIAATIRDSGADTFDAPATAAYYIECAIKEIERLHRDYSCICNEMRRMMEERDEARVSVCLAALPLDYKTWPQETIEYAVRLIAKQQNWDCFQEKP